MDEPEINIYYPPEWKDEYKQTGSIAIWRQEFPEMFDGSCGVPKPPYTKLGKMENFPNYALMYLLRKNYCAHSITYFRLAAKRSKEGKRLQLFMRQYLGSDSVDKLHLAIRAAGLVKCGFEGEPDLFCYYPDTDKWFFAEAKGEDPLLDTQRRWFRVCRDTIPCADIRVYRVLPHASMAAKARDCDQNRLDPLK